MSDPLSGSERVARLKRVVVGFTEEMLAGIDDLTLETNQCRSNLIREACSFYIEEKRRATFRERMKTGYLEMAELNRLLAEELGADLDSARSAAGQDDYGGTAEESATWRKA